MTDPRHLDLGIVTPVLTMLPGAHARWEEQADFADVVTIVQVADRDRKSTRLNSSHRT